MQGGDGSRNAVTPYQEKLLESLLDAFETPPWGGIPGMSHQEEAPGKTQEELRGPCLSFGLGAPQGSLWQNWRTSLWRGRSGLDGCPTTQHLSRQTEKVDRLTDPRANK